MRRNRQKFRKYEKVHQRKTLKRNTYSYSSGKLVFAFHFLGDFLEGWGGE